MKCRRSRHFIMVCTICLDKIDLQRIKLILLKMINCYPSIYTMDHPNLTVQIVQRCIIIGLYYFSKKEVSYDVYYTAINALYLYKVPITWISLYFCLQRFSCTDGPKMHTNRTILFPLKEVNNDKCITGVRGSLGYIYFYHDL